MTELELEKMQAEIERLTKENNQLRAEKGKNPHRDAFPDDVLDKYEPLKGILWKDNYVVRSSKKYKAHKDLGVELSRIIRAVLFPKKDGRYLACQDMTDEQYKQFVATLDDVLAALSKHREMTYSEEI